MYNNSLEKVVATVKSYGEKKPRTGLYFGLCTYFGLFWYMYVYVYLAPKAKLRDTRNAGPT